MNIINKLRTRILTSVEMISNSFRFINKESKGIDSSKMINKKESLIEVDKNNHDKALNEQIKEVERKV
jgi:hypothetical protein